MEDSSTLWRQYHVTYWNIEKKVNSSIAEKDKDEPLIGQ